MTERLITHAQQAPIPVAADRNEANFQEDAAVEKQTAAPASSETSKDPAEHSDKELEEMGTAHVNVLIGILLKMYTVDVVREQNSLMLFVQKIKKPKSL